jgi:hypothetical protein
VSRAGRALRDAPVERCPHCGRDSKTVSGGICADCRGVKQAGKAVAPVPPPKTSVAVRLDTDSDFWGIPGGYLYVALLVALVLACVLVTVR